MKHHGMSGKSDIPLIASCSVMDSSSYARYLQHIQPFVYEKKKSAICLMMMATEPTDPTTVQTRLLIGRLHGNTISYRATGHA